MHGTMVGDVLIKHARHTQKSLVSWPCRCYIYGGRHVYDTDEKWWMKKFTQVK